MTLHIPFDNSYALLPPQFYTRIDPKPVRTPRLLRFNTALADELGITPGPEAELTEVFSGNRIPDGAAPLAQAYAGHQFGGFNPGLGDGRANLLGEVVDINGHRCDIQLKGAGPTPYSRMGDGRAWMGPVLREYVVSEAMHALGVPTTRALAAVATGEPIYREQGALPGAVLTRVAASHIRVGTFQYFAARRDTDALRALCDHVLQRHYPQADGPDGLLREVAQRQAELVARWLSVGFIHGVMNTDNTTISGETIDYGPCAFLDAYHPQTVFSSIDSQGRYAYDNQINVITWNLAQFATSLLPLMPDQEAAVASFTETVHAVPGIAEAEWLRLFGAKIGLADPSEPDRILINDLLALMAEGRADFTNTFRNLARPEARDQFLDPARFDPWQIRWQARVAQEADWQARMDAANPAFIPRNHRIEQMITAAVADDLAPFHRLLDVLSRPYQDQPEACDLMRPPAPSEAVQQTYCGT